jgi:hypothetical protein
MLGAIALNFKLHVTVIPPLVLLVLAGFVAWGQRRSSRASISKK